MDELSLFLGLGNPGDKYKNNRHNVGFNVIEAIAGDEASFSFKKMLSAEISTCSCNMRKIILAKPQTFMNLSGHATRAMMDFYKIPLNNVYVFHDDIDLSFGRIKIKKGGGSGGHNGLKSIDNIVGSEYYRIRIGIGRPEEKSMVSSYVLQDFDTEQQRIIEKICALITEKISLLLADYKELELTLNQQISKLFLVGSS